MSGQDPSVTPRVTIRDIESKEGTAWNDDYTLIVPPNSSPHVFRTYERATPRPDETYFRNQNIALDQVPGRVADVFDQYVDAAQVGLSTAGDAGRELEREEATITVEAGGDVYTFAEEEIEDLIESGDVEAQIREEYIIPPNITTRSVRRILKEMCEVAEIQSPEGQANYFQPHGGRRGAGDTLYREQGASASQELLGHQDPETTAEAYHHIDATETANDASDVFSETDGM